MEDRPMNSAATNRAKTAFASLLAVLCAGCADGSAIATGNRYPPAAAASVQLYAEPPRARYEVVGLVRAESAVGASQQESMQYAIEELKKQAASLGANGVLLTNNGVRATGRNTHYDKRASHATSTDIGAQFVEGRAILVK